MKPFEPFEVPIAAFQRPFPVQSFRAVHTIDAVLPFGKQSSFLGVLAGDPATRRFRCLLLTVEGMTLCDLTINAGIVTVHRALKPFDDRQVALGFAESIRFIFEIPPGTPTATGHLPNRALAARWKSDGGTTEVQLLPEAGWQVSQYQEYGKLLRMATGKTATTLGFSTVILFRTEGAMGYALTLHLNSLEWVPAEDDWFQP